MSSSSSSIERKKYNQISKNEFVVNEENDTSKKTAPALKNNFDSQEKLRKKQAWREQYESSSVENSDADNAESDRSINEGRKNNYLTASPAVVRGRPQSSAQEEFDIVTTAASTASTAPTATTATTTTTTTFASTITTTTVPAQNNLGQASAVTMSVSDSLAQTAGSQINFPKINSNEAVVLMKNFINDAERKKLIINFQGEEGWRELRNFLSADDAKNIGEFSSPKFSSPKYLGWEIFSRGVFMNICFWLFSSFKEICLGNSAAKIKLFLPIKLQLTKLKKQSIFR
jgi:hypothetical protein